MTNAETDTYTFGNNELYSTDRLIVFSTGVAHDKIVLVKPEISSAEYTQALDDLNYGWEVLEDPKSGKRFEAGIIHPEYSSDGYDAEIATYTSALSTNEGNAVEFAEHGALHPKRSRLYLAGFGNGKSSYWDKSERAYIKQTGRFVQETGEPLPTVAALQRALVASNLLITRMTTNSAGGAIATALMAEMPSDQITHAYIKSRPNISNHPFGIAWGMRVLIGDVYDDVRYKKSSRDEWKMTKELTDEAVKALPNIYAPMSPAQQYTWDDTQNRGVVKLYTDMKAYSRGGKSRGHPAAHDTAAALQKHHEALITYHFPLHDKLYVNYRDKVQFLQQLGAAATVSSGQIEALMMPGAHRDHTQFPSLRWAAEKYAFSR